MGEDPYKPIRLIMKNSNPGYQAYARLGFEAKVKPNRRKGNSGKTGSSLGPFLASPPHPQELRFAAPSCVLLMAGGGEGEPTHVMTFYIHTVEARGTGFVSSPRVEYDRWFGDWVLFGTLCCV